MQKNGMEEGRTSEIATYSKTPVPMDQAGIITQGHPGQHRANWVIENRPVPDQSTQIALLVTLYWLPLRDTVL